MPCWYICLVSQNNQDAIIFLTLLQDIRSGDQIWLDEITQQCLIGICGVKYSCVVTTWRQLYFRNNMNLRSNDCIGVRTIVRQYINMHWLNYETGRESDVGSVWESMQCGHRVPAINCNHFASPPLTHTPPSFPRNFSFIFGDAPQKNKPDNPASTL